MKEEEEKEGVRINILAYFASPTETLLQKEKEICEVALSRPWRWNCLGVVIRACIMMRLLFLCLAPKGLCPRVEIDDSRN